jgi:hypothetical protein
MKSRWRGLWRNRKQREPERPATFVMDVEWKRSEELRPDRLGPTQEDVENPERVDAERWRPRRSLGPLPPG